MYTEDEIIEYSHDLATEVGNFFSETATSYAANMGAHLFFYADNEPLAGINFYFENFEIAFPYAEVDVVIRHGELQVTLNF